MGWIVRLFEKITGTPHRHERSAEVARASASLSHSIDNLTATLKPYREADDPLVALMTDVFNRRALQGRSDGEPELHS